MKKFILLTVLSVISIPLLFSQADTLNKTIYSFVPQYLINRGTRVDIEKQIHGRNFIQICPQFYLSEKENDNFINSKNQFNTLIGGGLAVYHKIFAQEDFKTHGVYFSYGVSYNYFHVEYIDDSGDYELTAKGDIHKFGVDAILGYQFFINEVVSIDLYTGLGTRLSYMNADGSDTDRFNTSYFGYNYTGNVMLLGFRIGILF